MLKETHGGVPKVSVLKKKIIHKHSGLAVEHHWINLGRFSDMVFMKTGFVGVDGGGSHSSQNLP